VLKSRVADVDDFLDTVSRVCRGGSVVDPALVQELVAARHVDDPLEALTPREREVLSLMAQGRSNIGIAKQLWLTKGTVEKHVRSILRKLDLQESEEDQRRVLAVIAYLDARQDWLERASESSPVSSDRIAAAVRSLLARKPTAGLVSMRSPYSLSSRAEIRMIFGARPLVVSRIRCATSIPLSSPRSMSIRARSSRCPATCLRATSPEPAVPMTSNPWSSSNLWASARKLALSSTIRQRKDTSAARSGAT